MNTAHRKHRALYEQRSEPVLPFPAFLGRLARHFAAALVVIGVALGIGVVGYHTLEGLPWIDALLNASMILGGMGPVDHINTDPGKVFASVYALASGLVLVGVAGLLLTPVLHRVLHRLHVE